MATNRSILSPRGGMVVNKGIGASMKPHNGFTAKGKK